MTRIQGILPALLAAALAAACSPSAPPESQSATPPSSPAAEASSVTATPSVPSPALTRMQPVAAGSAAAPTAAHPNHVDYSCEDGFQFSADVSPDRVVLHVQGREVTLPHVVSASGARYSANGLTYWSKGPDALYEQEGVVRHQCHDVKYASR